MSRGQAGQQNVVGGFVEQSGEFGQHDAIQAVGQGQRPALGAEQQLARLDGILRFDVGPAQLGQTRTDRHVFRRCPDLPASSSKRRKTASSTIGHDSSIG